MTILASLVILSYNQEGYIRSALESALAQNYTSLEIIVADDNSTDATRSIINNIARTYDGPHCFKTVLNDVNQGTLTNFQSGIAVATGDVILCGGGDDLLKPDRVSVMVKAWRDTEADALHSAYDVINENGTVIDRCQTPNAALHPVFDYIKDKSESRFVNGATAAYTRALLRSLPVARGKVFHEDALLTLIVHALGLKIHLVPIVTLDYRVHNSSFSNNRFSPTSPAEFSEMERRLARFAGSSYAYLDYFTTQWLPYAPNKANILDRIDIGAIKRAKRSLSRVQQYGDANLRARVRLLLASRSWPEAKAALMRIPGLAAFGHFKALSSNLKKNLRRH